jgi:exodeoxyribonuclease V alpha subunit
MIKGIGPGMAERMVAHFGTGSVAIIEQEPGRLTEVPGLGPKRAKKIAEARREQKAIKEVMVFLAGVGCLRRWRCGSTRKTAAPRSRWCATSRSGWRPRCGASGSRPPTPSLRRSGSRTTARSGSKRGCSTPCRRPPTRALLSAEPKLIREAAKILQVDRELIGPCLADLVAGEGAVREPPPATGDTRGGTVPAVYLVPFHWAERSLAGGLLGLLNSPRERLPAFTGVDWHKALGWLRSGPARAGPRAARGGQARA